MRIKKAKFVTSIVKNGDFPGRGLDEIAVAGKSNVGKSSLINRLCNNQKLARTSAEPGKTRVINIFLINEAFHLVDLPGYGYAKVSKGMQEDWGRMMNDYLCGSEYLKHIFHLVDIRHEPGDNDRQMADWIKASGLPYTVIATKADKLSRAQRQHSIQLICRTLAVQPWEVIPFSSVSGEGKEALLARIAEALGIEEEKPAKA